MVALRAFVALWLASAVVSAAEPSRMIPAQGLAAYLEYDGLDAHAAAWDATAAHAILEKTPAGVMAAELLGQLADRSLRDITRSKVRGADVVDLIRHLSRRGLVVAAHRLGDSRASLTVVLPGTGEKDHRGQFDRLLRPLVESPRVVKTAVRGRESFEHRGDPAGPADPGLAWWFEGDDLVILVSPTRDHVIAVIDAIEGKVAGADTHPGRLSALAEGKSIAGFEPDGLFFVEAGAFGTLFGRLAGLASGALPSTTGLLRGVEGLQVPDLPRLDFLPEPPTRLEIPQPPTRLEMPRPPTPPEIPQLPPRESPTRPGDKARPPAAGPTPAAPSFVPFAPFALGPVPRPALLVPGPEPAPPSPPDQAAVPCEPAVPGAVPPVPGDLPEDSPKALGLDGVTRVVGRFGFHGKALLSVVRVETRAPREGLLACLDVRPFRKDALPPPPAGASSFAVLGLDPLATYDRGVALVTKLAPGLGEIVAKAEAGLRDVTGLASGKSLFEHLGPTWTLFSVPDPDRVGHADLALVAAVRDPEALAKALDAIAGRVSAAVRDREARADDGNLGGDGDGPMLALERLPAPEVGYRLTSPSGTSFWVRDGGLAPTLLVGKASAALALHPREARAALAAESDPDRRQAPAGELRAALAALPDELAFLSCSGPDDSAWPARLAGLPALVQYLANFVKGDARHESFPGFDALSLLGLPEPGGFRVRIARSQVPTEAQVRPHLFPGVLAVAVDDRGFRAVSRVALPELVPPGVEWKITETFEWGRDGLKKDGKFRAWIKFVD